MSPGIVIPLIVLPVVLVVGYLWYRRRLADMRPDEPKPVSGARLTSQALHRLASPPWRIVHEIGGALGGVDHVIIGPPGVIAVTTVMADRPRPDRLTAATGGAELVAEAAVQRGPVDELARPAGTSCKLTARLFWGSPDHDRPAWDEAAHGFHLVEGQRLEEWLDALPTDGALSPAQVDLAWQAIVMGIGRPNPLPH